ncbi:hypothetical protein PMAYCL1PPCAC_01088, partial [Pristionchus mayeri]
PSSHSLAGRSPTPPPLSFSLLHSISLFNHSTMAKVLLAKMGAGKAQYGLAPETTVAIQTTEKTIEAAQKLIKAYTGLKKDFGTSLSSDFERATNTAGVYGK